MNREIINNKIKEIFNLFANFFYKWTSSFNSVLEEKFIINPSKPIVNVEQKNQFRGSGFLEKSIPSMPVMICRVEGRPQLPLPQYPTPGASGADLHAALLEPILLQPGQRAVIPTGLKAQILTGYEIQIRSLVSLAIQHGVTVLNAPGTINSDDRTEINVVLQNSGDLSFTVEPGMPIAQAVLASVLHFELIETKTLEESL